MNNFKKFIYYISIDHNTNQIYNHLIHIRQFKYNKMKIKINKMKETMQTNCYKCHNLQ
jgi:hypothetical protein